MADARVEDGEQGRRFYGGLHRLLLRLAGRMPDEWLASMRSRIAGGELYEVPDHVSGGVVEVGVSLTADDVAVLREVTRAVFGRDPMYIEQVTVVPETPASGHRFFPVPAGVLATDPARIPPRLDLTGCPGDDFWTLPPELADLDDLALRLTDGLDQLLVPGPESAAGLLSVARAWRFPADGPLDDGVRVVLVEVAESAPAYDIAGNLQRDLGRYGVTDPQVEVFWTGMELPPYHRAALAGSALLWRRAA
jgi:hypothetical protein